LLDSAINIASVANFHDLDDEVMVFNIDEYPVVTHTIFPQFANPRTTEWLSQITRIFSFGDSVL